MRLTNADCCRGRLLIHVQAQLLWSCTGFYALNSAYTSCNEPDLYSCKWNFDLWSFTCMLLLPLKDLIVAIPLATITPDSTTSAVALEFVKNLDLCSCMAENWTCGVSTACVKTLMSQLHCATSEPMHIRILCTWLRLLTSWLGASRFRVSIALSYWVPNQTKMPPSIADHPTTCQWMSASTGACSRLARFQSFASRWEP